MLYQGQQQDPESNMYYLRARYYDPATGRLISKDPIKGALTNSQSQNSYAYSLNNPINLSDPSGLWTVDIGLSASIGVGGLVGGVQFSQNGIYTYGGMGVATPGPGASIMYSPSDPETGLGLQSGGGVIAGGQVNYNYSDKSTSGQAGLTTPGYGVYTTQTNELVCF